MDLRREHLSAKIYKKRTLLISSGTHKYKKQMVKEAM